MGNAYSQAPVRSYDDTLLHDVPGITRESHLGKGRFLKTLKVIHDEGTAVCKIFIKPNATLSLEKQTSRLQGTPKKSKFSSEIRDTLSRFVKNPNALPFSSFIETDKAGYMLRQFFQNNLYDRLGTRPFLTTIEKVWITFQLLKAVERCHFAGICHGDLKTENVVVTSWNWIFVTDFAPYKPTYIPDYNPADFSYFFDTSGRRSCYIAPERFQKAVLPHTPANATEGADAEPTPSAPAQPAPPTPSGLSDDSQIESLMDIFSLGCVIAELWLEGTPLFNLSELLSYRNTSDPNRFNPSTRLAKIDNEHVRRLVLHMIQLNPDDRHSAGKYLKMWTSSLFPAYFHDLHTYMANLMDLEADDRVKIIAHDFDVLFGKFRASSSSSTAGSGAGLTATPGALVRSNTATSAEMIRTLSEPVKLSPEDTIRAEQLEARRLSTVALPPSFNTAMAEKAVENSENSTVSQIDSRSVKAQLINTQQLIFDIEALKLSSPVPSGESSTITAATEDEDKKLLQSLDEEDQSISVTDDPNQPEAALRKALAYYKQKAAEAKKSDDKSGLISAYESLSSVCRGLADFDRSRKYNSKLRDIAKQMSSFAALQRALTLSGVTEFETGELDSSCKYLEEAFKLAQDLDDRLAQCQLAARLAEVYSSFRMFDRVSHYQQLYDSLVQEIGASRVLASSVIASSGNIRPPKGTGNAISFHGSKPYRAFKSLGGASELAQAPGFVIILSMICSLLRNLRDQQTRLLALETLNRIAPHVEDSIRLQRIVPYVVSLLDVDTRNARSASLVTAHAIKTLTNVIGLVRNFPPSDAHIFPEYILPSLSFVTDDETPEIVVQAFAECLPKLADTALRFLETSQFFRQKSHHHHGTAPGQDPGSSQPKSSLATSGPTSSSAVSTVKLSVFQKEVEEIRNAFKDIVVIMLRDDAPTAVKKAIVSNISSLCVFFGKDQTNDVLLPLIFSCLNSKDWELKGIVFENVVGVSAVAGPEHIESWILTCIPPQIYDESEFVVAGAVNCLASLCDLGLFKKHRLLEIVDKTSPLLLHPNTWIRYGAACIILSISQKLSRADNLCFLIPKIRKYLVREVIEISRRTLLQSLLPPVSRRSYEKALSGNYGSNMLTIEQDMVIIEPEEPTPASPRATETPGAPEDQSQDIPFSLSIAELDLPTDDEKKIYAMKEFIKVSATKKRTRAVPLPDSPFHDEYRQISDRITVHEIPITAASSASLLGRDSGEQNEEWQDFFGKQSTSFSPSGAGPMSPGQDRTSDGARTGTDTPTGPGTPTRSSAPRKSDLYSFASIKRKPGTPNPISGQTSAPASPGTTGRAATGDGAQPGKPLTPAARASMRDVTGGPTPSAVLSATPLVASPALHSLPHNLVLPNIPKPPPELGSLAPGRLFTGQTLKSGWRPSGVLVAHLHEHGGPVNEIQVTRDNLFFASASDDGTVKIWDCQRLEKNVTNRSRLTYSSQAGKILSLCICENSHSVASASSSGSIHVFRVERIKRDKSPVPEYTGVSTVQNIDRTEGAVVKVDHFDALSSSQSLIVYATDAGIVHAWDLRARKEAWSLHNKPELGLISTFFLSPSRQWMTVGTNRGYISSWDIRFKVPFREWRLPDQSVVHQMCAAGLSTDGTPTSAFVAAGPGDFAEWSLESSRCTRLYRILSERTSKLPDVNPDSSVIQNDWGLSDLERPPRSTTRVRALAAALTAPAPVAPAPAKNAAPSAEGLGFVISAGTDKKIRYWDVSNAKSSYVISGLEKMEPKPVYHSYSAMEDTLDVLEELPGPYEEPIRAYDDTGLREPNLDPPATAHRDTILDLKILESPSRLLVSCSRDGVIKVWK